jgi:hypothetical protein
MAPDVTMPPMDTAAAILRIHRAGIDGRLLLLHYLASVDDGADVDLSDGLVAPQGANESDAAYREWRELAAKLANLHTNAAAPDTDWAPDIADHLLHIRPSDAPFAAREIMLVAQAWWTVSGYMSLLAPHVPAIEALLNGLMPPERRDLARRPLTIVGTIGTEGAPIDLDRAKARFVGTAHGEPFEGLHLAAAFAAALYQVPECVPNRTTAYRELAQGTKDTLRGRK